MSSPYGFYIMEDENLESLGNLLLHFCQTYNTYIKLMFMFSYRKIPSLVSQHSLSDNNQERFKRVVKLMHFCLLTMN